MEARYFMQKLLETHNKDKINGPFVITQTEPNLSSVGRLQLKCDGTRWHREGKWRGNWRLEWVTSTLHTTSEHGVSSITTADAHTSADSSRLNWRPRRFIWTRPFRRKTKSSFCACAITFQLASTNSPVAQLRAMRPARSVAGKLQPD